MFFYRAYAGLTDLNRPNDPFNNQLYSQFLYHRWGYAALLGHTLVASVVLNSIFLLGFISNERIRSLPHWPLLCLCVRDLLVSLILVPAVIDWLVVNLGVWGGGAGWCKAAGFLDFFLMAEYPLILIAFAIILYTRYYYQPGPEDLPRMESHEMINYGDSVINHSRAPSVAHQSINHQPHGRGSRAPSVVGSRAPSVVGSEAGYRHSAQRQMSHPHARASPGRGSVKQPFYVTPNRPGSVTGSIEGRLASGRMVGMRRQMSEESGGGHNSSRVSSRQGGGRYPSSHAGFRASSPLREVDENCSVGDADDLWDAASLDYPGREFESPRGWDEFEDVDGPWEVEYATWQTVLLCLTWPLAVGVGVVAAVLIEHFPLKRPGCFVPVDPFSNPYSATIDDPGYNFTLSMIIILYMIASAVIIFFLGLTCFHKMADSAFRTSVKILSTLTVVFVASRSPVDIIQFKALIEAGLGYNLRDTTEIEYEILLIWITYLPLILNPVIYFCYESEYRRGSMNTLRSVCGCKSEEQILDEKMSNYKTDEIAASRDTVSRTQVSNIL